MHTRTPTQKITPEEQHILSRTAKALLKVLPKETQFYCVVVLPMTPETYPYSRVRLISSTDDPQVMAAYLAEASRYAGSKTEFHGKQEFDLNDKETN